MTLPLERLIWRPRATVVAETRMSNDGLQEAIEQLGLEDLANGNQNTPIANMVARIEGNDPNYGGSGEDLIEFGGRQCYRSWDKGRAHDAYIENILEMAHGSVLAHANVSFLLTGISRSLSLELVRHHVGTAPSQESQRYVDGKDMLFVVPAIIAERLEDATDAEREADPELTIFRASCLHSLNAYIELTDMIDARLKADTAKAGTDVKLITSLRKRAMEAAREVLPNGAETRILYTTNLRALRHILLLRGSEAADLQIRRLAIAMMVAATPVAPVTLGDLKAVEAADRRWSISGDYRGTM